MKFQLYGIVSGHLFAIFFTFAVPCSRNPVKVIVAAKHDCCCFQQQNRAVNGRRTRKESSEGGNRKADVGCLG